MAKSNLRPIEARSLKSLMDTLRPHIGGFSVLDLFAGLGRLGNAAVSNGAASVTMVEKDRGTVKRLQKEKERLGSESKIVCADVFVFLKSCQEKFDLVFADPPYRIWDQAFSDTLISAVKSVLREGAILIVRHPKRVLTSPPERPFRCWKSVVLGESEVWYLKYDGEEKGRE